LACCFTIHTQGHNELIHQNHYIDPLMVASVSTTYFVHNLLTVAPSVSIEIIVHGSTHCRTKCMHHILCTSIHARFDITTVHGSSIRQTWCAWVQYPPQPIYMSADPVINQSISAAGEQHSATRGGAAGLQERCPAGGPLHENRLAV